MMVCVLKHSSRAAAFPSRHRTQADTPDSIFPYPQELRGRAAAGQSSRTGIAGFDAVPDPAFATTLRARVAAAVSLPLNAQVNVALAAGLNQALTAALRCGLAVWLTAVLRTRLDAALRPAFAARLGCELSPELKAALMAGV
jgi:hypothetical protein